MTYFIRAFGCQFNKADGEKIAQQLEKKGYKQSPTPSNASIVVILACSVRQKSVDKIFALISNIKSKNIKHQKIIVAGCVLPSDKKKLEAIGIEVKTFRGLNKIKPQTGLVEIGQGCDNFCSYCVVPYTRGKETYRSPIDILCEVKHLIKQGVKDITLIAQNVNSYKFGKTNFVKLLEMVAGMKGDFKVGFLTNHPKDMTDELIKAISILPKIKKEIHLPLQSGSTRILRKMNRHYTKQQYLKLVKKIRAKIPNVRLTTDIIVGFPTETKRDFQDTFDVMKKARYNQAFIAKYSPREGTTSFKLKDNVPLEEKKRREQMLMALTNRRH